MLFDGVDFSTANASLVRENGIFEPFIYKMHYLPRQARDKHRENSKKMPFSQVASMPGQCWDSRYNQTQSQTCSVSCRSYGKASIHYPNELGTVAET